VIEVRPEIAEARLDYGEAAPIVALETTLVAHGFPAGEGLDVATDAERRVREAGAVPATVGVVDGDIVVGLSEVELERFAAAGAQARKVGPRDLAAARVKGGLGATTVGGTLVVCALVGIKFMGTGGIGGVHRGFSERPDVSADLGELSRTRALVVSSGVKSLLDVPATLEVLETLGVPVLGWRTDAFPLFYAAAGGPPVPLRVNDAAEAAALARAHWELGRGGLLLAQAPAETLEIEPLLGAAVDAARAAGVEGQAVTPFVLSYLHRETGGATIAVNKRLIADNARLAGEVASFYRGY
jgi:pseudouridine-5'-phosphate glycosidase